VVDGFSCVLAARFTRGRPGVVVKVERPVDERP
jgi:hypothetical protein